MHETAAPLAAAPDLEALARDWITLWQSELAAIATDREAQESWQAILALWAGAAGALLAVVPRARPVASAGSRTDEHADRRAGTASPPGTAPAAAAPDPRDAEIDRLARHVAELEARLGELEHGVRRGGGGHRGGITGSEPRRQRR